MSKPDNSFYHFINFIFAVLVCTATAYIFMQGDRIDNFGRFLQFVSPLAIVFVGYWFLKKFQGPKFKGKEDKKKFEETVLYLTYGDRLKTQAVMFLLPLTVLSIAMAIEGRIYFSDAVQAMVVFAVFYLWQKWLFNKK